jgi:hypothetical protein
MSIEDQKRIYKEIIAQSEEVEELYWDPSPNDEVPDVLRKWVSDNVKEAIKAFANELFVMLEVENERITVDVGGYDWDVELPPRDLREIVMRSAGINSPEEYEQFARVFESIAAELQARSPHWALKPKE